MNEPGPKHDEGCMCDLCQLDKATEWESVGDMLPVGGGDASVAEVCSDLESGHDPIEHILTAVSEMNAAGNLDEVIVILNTMDDDDQYLLTNIGANDVVIGQLQVAMLNWYNTNIAIGGEL